MSRTLAKQIVDGLHELADALDRGEEPSLSFNVRNVELRVKATRYWPALVRRTRKTLNASQALFAKFLGVAPNTVRAWEQGTNTPSGIAARFLDEIRQNPPYWRARIVEMANPKSSAASARSTSSRR